MNRPYMRHPGGRAGHLTRARRFDSAGPQPVRQGTRPIKDVSREGAAIAQRFRIYTRRRDSAGAYPPRRPVRLRRAAPAGGNAVRAQVRSGCTLRKLEHRLPTPARTSRRSHRPCPPCRNAIPGPVPRRAANGAAAELARSLLPPPAAGTRKAHARPHHLPRGIAPALPLWRGVGRVSCRRIGR